RFQPLLTTSDHLPPAHRRVRVWEKFARGQIPTYTLNAGNLAPSLGSTPGWANQPSDLALRRLQNPSTPSPAIFSGFSPSLEAVSLCRRSHRPEKRRSTGDCAHGPYSHSGLRSP